MVVCVIALFALFPGLFAPHDPEEVNLDRALQGPSLSHPFGTDNFGRDVLSRVIHGARVSFLAALAVVGISLAAGTLLGLVAGYYGGILDEVLMRVVDILLALPGIIPALLVAGLMGPSVPNLILALAATGWVKYARLVRGTTMSLKGEEFVESARALGCSDLYILRRHILPGAASPAIALATLDTGSAILHIAGLSFLGLGAQPPTPEWGIMLRESIP
ncbi:MAG: ABC transporter permease, partial [Euryarchaeota archaeon]|nr:ABC transporter permease [Euryarchaeota archaeon]